MACTYRFSSVLCSRADIARFRTSVYSSCWNCVVNPSPTEVKLCCNGMWKTEDAGRLVLITEASGLYNFLYLFPRSFEHDSSSTHTQYTPSARAL